MTGFLVSRYLWGIWQGALLPVAYALATIGTRRVRSYTATSGSEILPGHTFHD
ncbi:hypothetical protein D9M71_498490 [compost metagenome]|jgi:hypothetical protein